MRQIFKEVELSVLELPVKGKFKETQLSDAQGMSVFRKLIDKYYFDIECNEIINGWRNK